MSDQLKDWQIKQNRAYEKAKNKKVAYEQHQTAYELHCTEIPVPEASEANLRKPNVKVKCQIRQRINSNTI